MRTIKRVRKGDLLEIPVIYYKGGYSVTNHYQGGVQGMNAEHYVVCVTEVYPRVVTVDVILGKHPNSIKSLSLNELVMLGYEPKWLG